MEVCMKKLTSKIQIKPVRIPVTTKMPSAKQTRVLKVSVFSFLLLLIQHLTLFTVLCYYFNAKYKS